jgi:hypothetical protein
LGEAEADEGAVVDAAEEEDEVVRGVESVAEVLEDEVADGRISTSIPVVAVSPTVEGRRRKMLRSRRTRQKIQKRANHQSRLRHHRKLLLIDFTTHFDDIS